MENQSPAALKAAALLLAAFLLIVDGSLFITAAAVVVAASPSSGCKALPPYVAESCIVGDTVFDGFRVCCNFLDRGGAECAATYLPELASAGVEDVSLFRGCLIFMPTDWWIRFDQKVALIRSA